MTPSDSLTTVCSQCGVAYPAQDLARFGPNLVCANCKPAFAQRLREGAAPGTGMRYAGFWIRVVAVLLDAIALFLVNSIFTFAIFGSVVSTRLDFARLGLSYLISLALGFSYYVFFWSRFGATPGKMALKLKVVTAQGGPISVGRAVGRYFAYLLSGFTLGIGYIIAAFDSEKRALHDHICNTRVIHISG
ncbi:MAG: RDD family protein [Bryobacteraceae bacterium]